MLALLMACTVEVPVEAPAEDPEAHHSHAEEDQLSITPRGIGPYRMGRSRAELLALPDAEPRPDGTVAFRGIVVSFSEQVACEVAMVTPGLTTAAGMEVGRPLSDFALAHGDLLTFPDAPWLRVRSDGGSPPHAAAIVLGSCEGAKR